MKGKKFLLAIGLMATFPLLAGPPMKYVDESGHVIYSDKPVPGAVRSEMVPVAPAPDEEEVKKARERVEKTERMAEEARRAREVREQEREEAREKAAREEKPVVIIKEEGGGGYYPEYTNPPLNKPRPPGAPGHRPGIGPGKPDHPAYRPPGARPPVSIQPVPR